VVVQHEGRTLLWMTFHQLIKTYYAPLLFRPLSFARCFYSSGHNSGEICATLAATIDTYSPKQSWAGFTP